MSKTINRLWIVTETAAGWRVQNVTNGRPARTYDTAGKALGAIHRSIKRLRKRLSMSATLEELADALAGDGRRLSISMEWRPTTPLGREIVTTIKEAIAVGRYYESRR